MEEKRLLLAVALSLLVLTAYQLLFARPPKPRASPTPAASAVPSLPAPSPSLVTGDAAIDARLKDALFKPSAESMTLPGDSSDLRFTYADGDIEAEKTLHFELRGYLVSVRGAARKAGRDLPVRVFWGPGIGNP